MSEFNCAIKVKTCIRWYLSYPLSCRDIEEMMSERGLTADHSTINRWVRKYSKDLANKFRRVKKKVGKSWRMDETYVKIKGVWHYLYRTVDTMGQTIDFMLSKKRDRKAALKFFKQAIGNHETPRVVNIDKSGANKAGLKKFNEEHGTDVKCRQVKYLNNIVESDHRNVKRIIKPMMGFKSFESADATLQGIELIAMLRKGQWDRRLLPAQNSIEAFWMLAA